MGDMSWFTAMLALLLSAVCIAMLLIARSIDAAAMVLLAHWQRLRVAQLDSVDAQEAALAEMLAVGFGEIMQLTAGSLRCTAVPAPHLAATCVDGARVFVTQQPEVLHRLGFARQGWHETNLTRNGALRRAEMQALWRAMHAKARLPHAPVRSNEDWHALLTRQPAGGMR